MRGCVSLEWREIRIQDVFARDNQNCVNIDDPKPAKLCEVVTQNV